MAAQETATVDSSGPRFAPDDPTLPVPWKALIDGATLYYWNPETNVTQYEKPAATAGVPPLAAGPPPSTPAQVPEPAPAAFSQPNVQFGQTGQAGHQERPSQAAYPPQAGQLGQQHTQHPAQQQPFQHQAPFQQVPYQQQQTPMPNQTHQYHSVHPQHMPYPHGPYMQPQQQQQAPPYSYQADQQPQMPQTAYNQAQQPPMPQPSYNQGQNQQPPMPQPSYNQGQQSMMPQSAYNQVQQPQIPQSYNQSQQPPGVRIPQSQGQHPQQSLSFHHPAQASQSPQVSQPQGLKMTSQQGQPQHGLAFIQHGKSPLSHGQQSPLLKDDDGLHEGKRTGFSLPLSQQHGQAPLPNQQLPSSHQHPGALSSQPNIPGVGGPLYPSKHLPGGSFSAETNNMGFMNSPAQMHQGGAGTNYQQKSVSGHAVPNHAGPSPIRPPMGSDMGNSDGHFERDDPHTYGRFDGAKALQQQPKLAALPTSQNPMGMHNGQPYPQPDNFGGYNMAPPHSVPNLHNLGPLPIGTSVRPPSSMLAPPDFPSISSADAYRQHHEVSTMGENVPAPFMTFESTGFPPEILREIHAAGFSNPTPIQAQTWPVALQNRDIVAIAKTGSGKTLGYLIPAFIHLRRCHNNPMLGPTVLVLAPTRELASQIQEEVVKFGQSSRVSCTCLYGGASKGPQLRELERGADIVVATPGRLNDILEMKKISLHQVSLLVLDEADRMLDMGFEPQIRKIVDEIPNTRQTLMYTATWPKEVTKIAGDLLRDPVQVNIGSIDELVANKSITQYVEVVPPMDKQRRLEQILRDQERGSKIIIFCSTKKMCDQLARGIGRNFNALSIHGDKSQAERDNVLNQFRTGRAPILVATDVAARGLDIKDIRVVINYDFPTGIEDYVHRIGRTGRAGATGVSYTFFSEQDWKHAGDLVKLLQGANQHVPPQLRDMAARSASGGPRNQAAGMSRWDGPGGSRFEPGAGGFVGYGGVREGPGGFGGREGPGGFVGRDGPGSSGFGGRGERGSGGFGSRGGASPGGFGGRGGRGDSPGFGGRGRGDFSGFGGRGRSDSPSFGGRGRGDFSGGRGGRGRGFGGRGRSDRGPRDRFVSDGRGRYDNRRGFGDKGRDRSYSRSPDRGRSRGYDRRSDGRSISRSRSRSRSWSRSRSRSRSWSRSRSRSSSRSRSRSNSRDHGAAPERRPRARSGFDVLPPAPGAAGPAPAPAPVPGPAAPPVPAIAAQQSLADTSSMSPMSPGGVVQPAAAPLICGGNDNSFGGIPTGQPLQGTDAAFPSFPAGENFPGAAVQQAAPDV
uniref:RNA helicase n=1 Tax=Zea mays TaxID=4577 RepID=A0A804NJD9_MAIZE